MDPLDPRHGGLAGYKAGCRDDCCRPANTRYDKKRRLRLLQGDPLLVDSTGTIRRIRALQAIGWTGSDIAERAGIGSYQAIHNVTRKARIYASTAQRIAAVYDELSMVVGPSDQGRRRALRKGWAPPLAWDDIDNDPRPNGRRHPKADYDSHELVDEATVLRVLGGENLPTNRAERIEIMRRWLAMGRSERSLCVRLGWHDGRYVPREEGDVA